MVYHSLDSNQPLFLENRREEVVKKKQQEGGQIIFKEKPSVEGE